MPADRLSATFAALADPTRRAILARLALGSTSVTELAKPFEMHLPAVSTHLKVLDRAGLIARGREAERIRYHHGGGHDDVEPVQFRTTVTFEDLGGNRTRLTLHAVFPSAAERERVIKQYGADKGAVQTLSRLADYLGRLSA